jgi:hypothetical protein
MRKRAIASTVFATALAVAFWNTPIASGAETRGEMSCGDVIIESLAGNVYADTVPWRELPITTFFTEGWDEPWMGRPTGEGGAPRQGWLNTFDGVFYRLVIGTYGYAHADRNVETHTGTFTAYLPLNRRFELRADLPGVAQGDSVGAGDDVFWTRFMLHETRGMSHSMNVGFKAPTGDTDIGNGVASIIPQYEFWTNYWGGLVVRGGVGVEAPYGHQSIRELNARTQFLGNLGIGYYLTEHGMTPIGDLVLHATTNLKYAMDDRGPSTTTVTITPGFRTHLGRDWYLLGGVEVPTTDPEPFDYQVLAGLMKVF